MNNSSECDQLEKIFRSINKLVIKGLNSEHFEFKVQISRHKQDKKSVRLTAGESEQIIIRTGEFPVK